jgi:hypothetical protein
MIQYPKCLAYKKCSPATVCEYSATLCNLYWRICISYKGCLYKEKLDVKKTVL